MSENRPVGVKYDQDKPPIGMIPKIALEEEARVFNYGASKYGRDNYKLGMDWTRLINASLRHILAFNDGQDVDPESMYNHLAHARACLGMLMLYQEKQLGKDDR